MAKRKIISGPDIPQRYKRFPTAVKVGNMVFTTNIGGEDPATHELPDDAREQVRNAFQNVRNILARAGGDIDDIGKFQVALTSLEHRPFVNEEWLAMFPDDNDRPVRHTVIENLSGCRIIGIEIVAVL